jgi:diaminopimelate epimerase
MELRFEKFHGIGNDFLVVEAETPDLIPVARAMELCQRHFGVGGDGVLVVSPPTTSDARATMTVINSDGSTPEMCGNGLRCVALHLARKAQEESSRFLVDTGAGPLQCDVARKGNHGEIGTDIGWGKILPPLKIELGIDSFEFRRVSTGNPHAISFQEQIDAAYLDQLGPAVSQEIEGGTNVEIATIHSRQLIRLAVWERGVGRTLACGTGAAATTIAAIHADLVDPDVPVRVELPGGPLELTVTKDLRAYLKGPACWVYSGSTIF